MPRLEEVAKQSLEQRLGRMSRTAEDLDSRDPCVSGPSAVDRANATPAAIAASASSGTPHSLGSREDHDLSERRVREVWRSRR